MNFILVDRLVELRERERARFVKCCSLSEDFYMQHFPGFPVLPGALVIESFVQAATLFLAASGGYERWPIPRAIANARFFKLVQPGDRLVLDVEATDVAHVAATARVEGELVVSAALAFDLVEADGEGRESVRSSLEMASLLVGMLRGAQQ